MTAEVLKGNGALISGNGQSTFVPPDPSDFTLFSPALNDSPLEFNVNKTKSSMIRSTDDKDDSSLSPSDKRDRRRVDRRDRDRRDNDKARDESDSNMSNSQDVLPIQNGPGMGPNMWGGMMGEFYIKVVYILVALFQIHLLTIKVIFDF